MRAPRTLFLGIGGLIASGTIAVVLLSPAGSVPLVSADPPPPPPPGPCQAEQDAVQNLLDSTALPFGGALVWMDGLLNQTEGFETDVDSMDSLLTAQALAETETEFMPHWTPWVSAYETFYGEGEDFHESMTSFLTSEDARLPYMEDMVFKIDALADCLDTL